MWRTHRFAEDKSIEPRVGPEVVRVVDAGLADRTADLMRAVNQRHYAGGAVRLQGARWYVLSVL